MPHLTIRFLRASLLIPGFASLLLLCWQRTWPQPVVGIYLGLAAGLLVVQAIWFGFGRHPSRFPIVAVGVNYIAYVLSAGNLLSVYDYRVILYCACVFAGTLIPSMIARFVYKIELSREAAELKLDQRPKQFGVATLLGMTAGIAILIVLQQWKLEYEQINGVSPELWFIKHAFCFSGVAGVAMWSMLGSNLIRPLLLSAIAGTAGTIFAYQLANNPQLAGVKFGSSVLTGWILVTAYCFLLRSEGFRLKRKPIHNV